MCINDICFLFFLAAIVLGFAVLIYFLLRFRKSSLKDNLLISGDQIWETVSGQAGKLKLLKSDLLFSIHQDYSNVVGCLLVKNVKNQVVGKVHFPIASRRNTILIGDKEFVVEFPLTWNRTAILRESDELLVRAKYIKKSWLGRHEFEIPGYGTLDSARQLWGLNVLVKYKLRQLQFSSNEIVGFKTRIPSIQEKGNIVLLPAAIPLEVQIFILVTT